jgi:putative ABC transport system permease protein
MIRLNFLVALRNFRKHKLISTLNVVGLAVGMGVCLVIYQYVSYEGSFDGFHRAADRTYRIIRTEYRNGERSATEPTTPFALGVRGKEEIAEVENFTRMHPQYLGAVVTNPDRNEPFKEMNMLFVDSTFLEVFNFPLKQGDIAKSLSGKYNIVITERIAKKYFAPNVDPVGKTLSVSDSWADGEFTVTGVLKTPASNTHLVFDFLMPMQVLLDGEEYKGGNGWGRNNFITYVTLEERVDTRLVQSKLNQVVDGHLGKRLAAWNLKLQTDLQPITNIHLRSEHITEPASNNGSIRDVRILAIVGVLILVIGCINFVNLSTARSMERAREVGIRKTAGARRGQLVVQFLAESLVINVLAAGLAVAVAILLLPVLNDITGKQLTFVVFNLPEFWAKFTGLVMVSTLFSGLYPALALSAYKPLNAIRADFRANRFSIHSRKAFIVAQFFISAFLISATALIYKQVLFMKSQNLGVDIRRIVVVSGPGNIRDRGSLPSTIRIFKDKVLSHSDVTTAAGSGTVPGKGTNWLALIRKFQDPPESNVRGGITYVDFDFFDTYDFHFLSGRTFDIDLATDRGGVVINEEAGRMLGLEAPENAIGQKIIIEGGDTVVVLGVLKNYHWNSLRDAYTPYLFLPAERAHRYFSFTLTLSDIPRSLDHIQSSFDEVFPDNPFEYFFLDEEFNRQYQSDLQFGALFASFSLLAIFIACLGLFAVVSFSSSLRLKELGIRKVLGARPGNLVLLLAREYILLLIIANIFAIPAVIYSGNVWLKNFAFKTDIGFDIMLIPGLVLICMAVLSVINKFYSLANNNPINILRKD